MKEIILDEEKLSDFAEEIDTRKDNKEIRDIVLELKEIVREKKLNGLSAPQIGYNKRIFVINFNGDIRTFINPILSKFRGMEFSRETCSSIPDKTFIRLRYNDIDIMYQTPLGKIESRRLVGLAAKVFQHQLDHLDGLLLTDVALEIDDDFINASDEDQEKILNMYLDSLDLRQKEIDKEIKEDEDLSKIAEGMKFMEGVAKGEIEIES